MAKNGPSGSKGNNDPHIDEWIDAAHPGLGPKTPSMTDARATQRRILEQRPKTGKNYQASPDDGTASLSPFENWKSIGKAFK